MARIKFYNNISNQWEYADTNNIDSSSNVAIDHTLSKEGQAADAKAVGDALANKQPKGNYLTEVPSGYVTDEELNSKGYLTEHQDLTGYAKKTDIPSIPVQSVNGKTGAVSLNALDIGADASGTANSEVNEHNTSTDAHADIRELISGLSGHYVVSDEPPEAPDVLWINTSESEEAVALGVTAVETADGVMLYCTDEIGTTEELVRHGKDGAPGDRYELTDDDRQEIAGIAAGLVEVPGGGGIAISGARPGQLARISAVDEHGVPTAWEPVSVPAQEILLLENTIEIPQDSPVNELEWELPASARYCDSFVIELHGTTPTNAPDNSVGMMVSICGVALYGGNNSNGSVRKDRENWIVIHTDLLRRSVINTVYNNSPDRNSSISSSVWTLRTVLPAENRTNMLRAKLSTAYAGTMSVTVLGYTGWEVPDDV